MNKQISARLDSVCNNEAKLIPISNAFWTPGVLESLKCGCNQAEILAARFHRSSFPRSSSFVNTLQYVHVHSLSLSFVFDCVVDHEIDFISYTTKAYIHVKIYIELSRPFNVQLHAILNVSLLRYQQSYRPVFFNLILYSKIINRYR